MVSIQKIVFWKKLYIKFSFSEKATKICAICLMVWTFTSTTKRPKHEVDSLRKFSWPSQESSTFKKDCNFESFCLLMKSLLLRREH